MKFAPHLILTIISVLVPNSSYASEVSLENIDLTQHAVGFMALFIFVIAYTFVILEEQLHLKKSKPVLLAAGIIAESLAWLMRPFMHWNPKVSRFAVNYICSDFTFNSNAANRDFGFSPKFDNGEALNRTAHWFRLNGPTEAPVISPEPAVSG